MDEVVSRGAAIMAASLCVPETYDMSSQTSSEVNRTNEVNRVNGNSGVNLDKKLIVKEKWYLPME